MKKNLICKANQMLFNERITELRTKINATLLNEDRHFERNDLISEIQKINLNYKQLKSMDIENVLFYLNYNKKFAFSKFENCSYEDRLEVLNRLLSLNMTEKVNKINLADFILWSINYIYKDQDMLKLVKYFCKNTNLNDSAIFFDVYSVLTRQDVESLCRKEVEKKHEEIYKQQENKFKSRINL